MPCKHTNKFRDSNSGLTYINQYFLPTYGTTFLWRTQSFRKFNMAAGYRMDCRNGEIWRQRDHLGGSFAVVQTRSDEVWYSDGNQNRKEVTGLNNWLSVCQSVCQGGQSQHNHFSRKSFLMPSTLLHWIPQLEFVIEFLTVVVKLVIVIFF